MYLPGCPALGEARIRTKRPPTDEACRHCFVPLPFLMSDVIELNERDAEILETLVGLAGGDADWFFEIPIGADRIPSPPWPGSIPSPHRNEIRSLVNRDLLEI